MANPTQQPNQADDCREQDLYQPVSNQPNVTYGADGFDLALFNTPDTSTENFWADILTGLAVDPIDEHPPDPTPSRDDDAATAATHQQQTMQAPLPTSAPPTSNTSASDSDQPRQYPVTHFSNNDMVTSLQTEGIMSRQENRYGQTITLPTTLGGGDGGGGGRAHRTYAFSPACNVGVRRGGKLVSVVKRRKGCGDDDDDGRDERQVLHFTANRGTAAAAAADHRGEEGRRGHRGAATTSAAAAAAAAAAATNGESSSHDDDNNNNDGNGGGGDKSEPDRTHSAGGDELVGMPFKVVGFGPCQRCCREETRALCDRSYPCRACVGQAGGDAAAAMELCRLPVVERPDDAVDGDELIDRGVVRVVRPGMVVVVVGEEE
ncbi:hypothetical protein SLS58_010580 [Diplodia intermedia]|uniref:Uncharacterized protein n=1 Tax=Diplodia intermedia TaxID=856260 RepID=A0ABR3T5L9_9PEZI